MTSYQHQNHSNNHYNPKKSSITSSPYPIPSTSIETTPSQTPSQTISNDISRSVPGPFKSKQIRSMSFNTYTTKPKENNDRFQKSIKTEVENSIDLSNDLSKSFSTLFTPNSPANTNDLVRHKNHHTQDSSQLSTSVPSLSREFVVRRLSEGESGRLKEELKCEACGKGYRHLSSLVKHLWEHTPEWKVTEKLAISKHQQVQLLEAASILVSMNDQIALKDAISKLTTNVDKSNGTNISSDQLSNGSDGTSTTQSSKSPLPQQMKSTNVNNSYRLSPGMVTKNKITKDNSKDNNKHKFKNIEVDNFNDLKFSHDDYNQITTASSPISRSVPTSASYELENNKENNSKSSYSSNFCHSGYLDSSPGLGSRRQQQQNQKHHSKTNSDIINSEDFLFSPGSAKNSSLRHGSLLTNFNASVSSNETITLRSVKGHDQDLDGAQQSMHVINDDEDEDKEMKDCADNDDDGVFGAMD